MSKWQLYKYLIHINIDMSDIIRSYTLIEISILH